MRSVLAREGLDPVFDQMYAAAGHASVPPEALLKSTVLMAMYSIRSERAFCERLNYDLLFKWFLDMRIDQPAFDATRSPRTAHACWTTRSRTSSRGGGAPSEAAPLHLV